MAPPAPVAVLRAVPVLSSPAGARPQCSDDTDEVCSGVLNVGSYPLPWRVVHSSRGGWKLVVSRLRVSKRLQAPPDMYGLGGEFERACETAQVDLVLPEHGEGRQNVPHD